MDTAGRDETAPELVGKRMEYATLREEILKRIELREKMITTTLTIAGGFLGFGLTYQPIALIYPPLAMLLAFASAQNAFRIKELAQYISDHLEGTVPGLQYERSLKKLRDEGKHVTLGSWQYIVLSHGGLFLLTQLMALGIGMSKFGYTLVEWTLFFVDYIAIWGVAMLVVRALIWKSPGIKADDISTSTVPATPAKGTDRQFA